MNKIWTPLIVALLMAIMTCVGMFIGQIRERSAMMYQPVSFNYSGQQTQAGKKFSILFDLLNNAYVDSLDVDSLVENAVASIVEELDPHSNYIPASDLQAVNEQLDGSFSGIGVQFNIQEDTVMVIQVIAGGPSDRLGLMAGDRIVTVDDSLFCGKDITNERVLNTLRGPKNSHVKLGIRRASSKELLYFDITRGEVPVNSVVASYIVDEVGYIRVDNFGRNTYTEFMTSLIKLRSAGAKGILVDLRGNGGGYLEVCILMVNEFLSAGNLIVYTEGMHQPRQNVNSDGRGTFQNLPVAVLIDDWSASASEIFSGAIQDNDRGTIIGRRSFGKGLVQQQFDMLDGSALRLTIARYYTPSGRCIQKPYKMGERESYLMDVVERYNHGEFYSQDSIHLADSLAFYTVGGRKVYAGGGIMPDIFIPSDTSFVTPYYNMCINKGVLYSFAFQWSDRHRDELSTFNDYETFLAYLEKQKFLTQFVEFAREKVPYNASDFAKSKGELDRLIKAYIMRQIGEEDWFYRMYNSCDPCYLKGIEVLKEGKVSPLINER